VTQPQKMIVVFHQQTVICFQVRIIPQNMSTAGLLAVYHISQAANAERPDLTTVTTVRQRVSTIYASLDIPANLQQNFYKDTGTQQPQMNQFTKLLLPAVEVGKCCQPL